MTSASSYARRPEPTPGRPGPRALLPCRPSPGSSAPHKPGAPRQRAGTPSPHSEIPIGPDIDQQALRSLIRRRGGVLRAAELARTIGDRPATRLLVALPRLLPGVHFAAARSPNARDRRLAALRYVGSGALLTGLTALRLYGFRRLPAEWEVHVLVPTRQQRRSASYAVIEHTRAMPRHRWRDGLPCAPPARAVVDATRRLRDPGVIRGLVAQALDRNLCSVTELAAELRTATGPGLGRTRQIFGDLCDELSHDVQAELHTLLERARLPPAVSASGQDGGPVAHWPGHGVAACLDFSPWALTPGAALRGRADRRSLSRAGYTVIAITPDDLSRRPAAVLSRIATAVRPPEP